MIVRVIATLMLLVGSLADARAQARLPRTTPAATTAPVPGSEISVTLITFGLGHEVFERFGHNALLIEDAVTGQSAAYHWGLFSFTEPGFLVRFLTGDTRYWLGAEDGQALIDYERRAGRPTTLQRLNLTPAQAKTLRDFVQWNALEENKYYRYDYFRDNCSTRLRDAIDRALGGTIQRATDSVRTMITFRNESLRLTDGDSPVQAGIDIALGRPADVAVTQRESFFIPMRLRDALRTIRNKGADGADVPLVATELAVALPPEARSVPEAQAPPSLTPRYLLAGLLLAALVAALRVMMVSRRSAAWGLALFGAGWSLVCGVLGVLLLLAWLATKHVFWAYNEHVLLLTPLSLALVILIPASILSARAERAARMIAAFIALLGLVAMVMALIPGGQRSGEIVALLLPVHLALAWALALPKTGRSVDARPRAQ